ncbi:MAG: D-3-phosphoglycerate dehydrogenase, partial [Bacteriovoracaceae bacterium]
KDSERAITALETIDDSILKELPKLKVIGKYGVGLDMLDFDSMENHDVKLGWTPGVNKLSVAELVISFSINLLRGINFSNYQISNQTWTQYKGRQLSSITFGIIGLGNIGKEIVRLLEPFGTKIVFHDIREYPDFENTVNITRLPLKELLMQSDIVSIHVPKNKSTINLLNKKNLSLLKRSSFVINTARGGLINEVDLIEALNTQSIAGAALDVFEEEPNFNKYFIENPNVIMTPHIGGSSLQAITKMGLAAIDGLENFKRPTEFNQYK